MRAVFTFFVFLVASCNTATKNDASNDNPAGDSGLSTVQDGGKSSSVADHQQITGCYIKILKRDTIVLHLE